MAEKHWTEILREEGRLEGIETNGRGVERGWQDIMREVANRVQWKGILQVICS